MSLGIVLTDTIVSTVAAGVAVYNEILGDPATDPEIAGNNRRDMKRTRRRVPQTLVRRVASTLPLKPETRLKIPVCCPLLHFPYILVIYVHFAKVYHVCDKTRVVL